MICINRQCFEAGYYFLLRSGYSEPISDDQLRKVLEAMVALGFWRIASSLERASAFAASSKSGFR
jgi:hypothetical protein